MAKTNITNKKTGSKPFFETTLPLLQTLAVYGLFIFLGYLGIKNDIIKNIIVLAISWPLLMWYDEIFFGLIKNYYLAKFFIYFTKSAPLLFPTFFLTLFIQGTFFGLKSGLLNEIDYTIFSACYIFIMLFDDYQYLLTILLSNNSVFVRFFNRVVKIGKRPVFDFLEFKNTLSKDELLIEYKYASNIVLASGSVMLIFSIVVLSIAFGFIFGDVNHNPVNPYLFFILPILIIFMVIGTLNITYASRAEKVQRLKK